jgi:serine protease Do
MSRMNMSLMNFPGLTKWAVLAAIVLGGGAIARAQDNATPQGDEAPTGKIVRIGPAGDSNITLPGESGGQGPMGHMQVEAPKYWIGLLGGPVSDELRAQVDVPANQGVLVRQVVPGSPADKAGLKAFDILLRANDTDLHDISNLTELVKSEGESSGEIKVDVLRKGQLETLTVKPEARPDQVAGMVGGPAAGQGWGVGGMGPGQNTFRVGPNPFQFRMFGPGTAMAQQGLSVNQMPNGVSVSIQKQNDEPAHITVKRGNDTWNIVGDDPGSLAQLPEDVRPFVEQLLTSGGRMQMPMPAMPAMPAMPNMAGPFHDEAMQQQLQRMEEHLQQMQQQLEQQFGHSPAGDQTDQSQSDTQ